MGRWLLLAAFVLMTVLADGPTVAWAKTLAYVLDASGAAHTLDTETDIELRVQEFGDRGAEGIRWRVAASPADDLLLLVRGDRSVFEITVYGFWDLHFKRNLKIVTPEAPAIVLPPVGPHFFVKWFDPQAHNGQGGEVATRFDKATLAQLDVLPVIPPLQGPPGEREITFSADGRRLYAYRGDIPGVIETYDTRDLHLVETCDIAPYLIPGTREAEVIDLQAGRALISESIRSDPRGPGRLVFFTMRLSDEGRSPRIAPGMSGTVRLTPQGDKILFNEMALSAETHQHHSIGRLHVYDVATGAKLGQVSFTVYGDGRVKDIRPQGDKAYFFSEAFLDLEADKKSVPLQVLTSLSLVDFSVVKEIKLRLPYDILMIFFEQPKEQQKVPATESERR